MKMTDKEFQALLDKLDDLPETMSDKALHKSSAIREAFSRPAVKEKRSKIMSEVQNRPEVIEKRVKAWKERLDKGSRQRMSKSQREAQNREETRAKRSRSLKASHGTEEVKAKLRAKREEVLLRPGFKEKLSASIREGLKNLKVSTCPHCGVTGRGGIMKRWHFDNCKHKP